MNPWRGLKGLPSDVWLVCASTLVNRMGTMALPFLVLYLTEGRRWTPGQAGTAMMIYGAGALLTGPFAGRLADAEGHARILKLSLWSSGGLLLFLPLVASRPALYAVIFLWAALTQAFWPSAMALLAGLAAPEKRKAVYSLHRLAVNLGMAVGPALGGVIAHHAFRWVFWTDGLTTLAGAAVLTLFLRSHTGPAPRTEAPASLSPWRDRRLTYLLLAFLPVLMVFFQIEGALPLWVTRDLGYDTRFFGLIFTLNTLVIVALEVPLNLAMAHWRHGPQLLAGALCYAVGFGLTGLVRSQASLLGTVVIWTFGEMILLPAMADAVATLAPTERRGEYMGLYSTTFAAGLALGPWLGVLAYAHLGPRSVWLACFLTALVGGALLGRFRAHPSPGRQAA